MEILCMKRSTKILGYNFGPMGEYAEERIEIH